VGGELVGACLPSTVRQPFAGCEIGGDSRGAWVVWVASVKILAKALPRLAGCVFFLAFAAGVAEVIGRDPFWAAFAGVGGFHPRPLGEHGVDVFVFGEPGFDSGSFHAVPEPGLVCGVDGFRWPVHGLPVEDFTDRFTC